MYLMRRLVAHNDHQEHQFAFSHQHVGTRGPRCTCKQNFRSDAGMRALGELVLWLGMQKQGLCEPAAVHPSQKQHYCKQTARATLIGSLKHHFVSAWFSMFRLCHDQLRAHHLHLRTGANLC